MNCRTKKLSSKRKTRSRRMQCYIEDEDLWIDVVIIRWTCGIQESEQED